MDHGKVETGVEKLDPDHPKMKGIEKRIVAMAAVLPIASSCLTVPDANIASVTAKMTRN